MATFFPVIKSTASLVLAKDPYPRF